MKENQKEVTYTYNIIKLELLEWEADVSEINTEMKWQPEVEIAIDSITEKAYSLLYLDTTLYLSDNKDDFAVMIKTRTVFTVTLDTYKCPDELMAHFLHYSIAHTRAMCKAKCADERITLPIIPFYTFNQLFAVVNLAIHKPSVNALTYEQKGSGETIVINTETIKSEATEIGVAVLWFEVFSAHHPENIISGLDENAARLSFNFDYEKIKEEGWKLHFNWRIKIVNSGEISVRSSYFLNCSEDETFSISTFEPLSEKALDNCIKAYNKECVIRKLNDIEEFKLTKEQYQLYCNNFLDQHQLTRKKNHEQNEAMGGKGLSFTVGGNTRLVLKATFIILDELLFTNPLFNRKHNVQALQDTGIWEQKYYTIKLNCLQIEQGGIQLTWVDSIFFMICLDIALQILVSEHGDLLQPALVKNNFTPFRQQEFIKFGSDFLLDINTRMKEGGMNVINLEERKDWASIIR